MLDKQGKQIFFKQMFAIALPIALQNIITVAVGMADTIMLGSLGETQLSASALANQLFFIFMLVVFGTSGGTSVMVAQFWGKRDVTSIKKVLAYTYRVVIGIAILMILLSTLFPQMVLSFFTNEPEVIAEGVKYLRVVSIGYIFFGISTITSGVLRSVHNVKIAVVASAVSVATNIFFNWVFIFGNLGAPALGVTGAAIATTIARIVECAIIVGYALFVEKELKIRIKELWHLDLKLAKSYFQNVVPVMCNELLWSLGASMLSAIMGHMGSEVVSANSIYSVVAQFSGVLVQGISSAAAVLVGNTIGAGEYDTLDFKIRALQVMGIIVGIISFLIVFFSRPLMMAIYNVGDTTKGYVNQIMIVGAFLELINSLVFVNMVGILRGGGDAKFVLVNDILFLWILAVPLGYLAGLVWHWPIPLVFFVLKGDTIIKCVTSFIRIHRRKWIKNVTEY